MNKANKRMGQLIVVLLGVLGFFQAAAEDPKPNSVIIFTDDQGYADVGRFGAAGFETPNLDRMAEEGTVFRNFHVAQPVCSASRAGLLTGCYPIIMEIDWSVGQILDALKRCNLVENTWVVFTSDNGPWLSYGNHAGSAGPLREGKGTAWEGGTRVPCIMRWPGKIPAGADTMDMLMTIDLLPTHDVSAFHPEIVKHLEAAAQQARAELGDRLVKRSGAGNREPGRTAREINSNSAAATPGFQALLAGEDLNGWWGADTEDPGRYVNLPEEKFRAKREASLANIREHWTMQDGELVNDGHGLFLTTEKLYADFELLLEYKTVPLADSGIYLRGCPQVQIWDSTEEAKFKLGADKGSGGLWNNSPGAPGKDPLVKADRPFGEWNRFRIIMVGSRVWVWLNDQQTVNGAILENYFDRQKAVPPRGPIQLQTHGGEIRWRNIFIREIGSDEANQRLRGTDPAGFTSMFNGKDLSGWKGPVQNYEMNDGALMCKPGEGGTIYTDAEFTNFVARLEFKLPPGGNNGLAIRYPGSGDAAYVGMCELQVLDNEAPKYSNLDPRQFHGSAYGMAAAQRGYLRPAGEWNYQEVTVRGSTIKVELNGTIILDTDLASVNEFMGGKAHPGKDRLSGHFGFAGHNDPVMFRKVSIKRLD